MGKILEFVFPFDKAQGLRPSPSPSSPQSSPSPQPSSHPASSTSSTFSTLTTFVRDLADNVVTSRNIMGETITPRNLSKNLLFLDEYFLDLSPIDPGGNTEGLKLPQSNDCSKGTEEGWVCWDRDDNVLTIGTGDSRSQFYGFGPAIDSPEITNGTVSFDDLANSSTLDATTTWALGTNNLVINLDSTGDFILQDNGTAFATFADDGSTTLANDLTISGNDLIFGNSERIVNTTDGTIGFTDGTNTLASIIDQGAYGTLRLTNKGSTGDPSTCTAGDIYFNQTDATMKGCTAANTWEALDGGGGLGYTLQVATGPSSSPADSTTYYLANALSVQNHTSAAANATRVYIPKAGTITAVYGVATVTGTLGTSESSTLAVRLNDTTSTTITSSLAMSSATNTFSNSSLSIAVVAGDYINITLATPAWVTNPTSMGITLSIYIE